MGSGRGDPHVSAGPPRRGGASRHITMEGSCPSVVGAPPGRATSGDRAPWELEQPVPDACYLLTGLRGGCHTRTLDAGGKKTLRNPLREGEGHLGPLTCRGALTL